MEWNNYRNYYLQFCRDVFRFLLRWYGVLHVFHNKPLPFLPPFFMVCRRCFSGSWGPRQGAARAWTDSRSLANAAVSNFNSSPFGTWQTSDIIWHLHTSSYIHQSVKSDFSPRPGHPSSNWQVWVVGHTDAGSWVRYDNDSSTWE